jgi:hypothetical protein
VDRTEETARRLAVSYAQHDVYAAAGKLGMAVRHNRPRPEVEQLRRDLDATREHLDQVKSA